MAWLRLGYEYVAFYLAVAGFGLGCLIWSLPAALLYRVLPRSIGEPLGKRAITAGFRFFIRATDAAGIIKCDLAALDALQREPAAVIIAPNHPSLLDAVLVLSRLTRVLCIMKPQIWDNWFLGGGARLAGYIRNDDAGLTVKRSAEGVQAGNHLLIFPEGTRTVRPPLNGFKGGFALIAQLARAPVQTVFIEANSPFLNKSWPFFQKPHFPLRYRVRLGRRFEVGTDVRPLIAELESYYRQELRPAAPGPQS